MNILVLGGSGPLGREVLRQGVAKGHVLTALVRHPEKFERVEGVRVAAGDVLNRSSIETALVGQRAVISVLGTPLSRKPTTVLSAGTRNLVAAMTGQRVERLICVTGIGAGDSRGHGGWLYDRLIQPLLLNEVYRDKTRQEEVIRESGLQWVIVRPAQLTHGAARGGYRVLTDLAGQVAKSISRADVAEFLLKQVDSDEYLGKSPVISY